MKKHTIIPVLTALLVVLFASCNSKTSSDSCMKDDSQRKEMMHAIVQNQSYSTEMMSEMMNNDNCKHMMMDNMMNNPEMKGMCMDKMMSMCKDDTAMCKKMMGSMDSHSSMKGGCCMDKKGMGEENNNMKTENTAKGVVYTCPMHPEVIKDKPGKCPKCGMDLVKKK